MEEPVVVLSAHHLGTEADANGTGFPLSTTTIIRVAAKENGVGLDFHLCFVLFWFCLICFWIFIKI